MVQYFFSLSVGQAFGFVFFGSILVISTLIIIGNDLRNYALRFRAKFVMDNCDEFEYKDDPYALSHHSDEFEDRDDPYAVINQPASLIAWATFSNVVM